MALCPCEIIYRRLWDCVGGTAPMWGCVCPGAVRLCKAVCIGLCLRGPESGSGVLCICVGWFASGIAVAGVVGLRVEGAVRLCRAVGRREAVVRVCRRACVWLRRAVFCVRV